MKTATSLGLALFVGGLPSLSAAQSTFELDEIVVLPLAVPAERERTGASVETLDRDDIEEGGNLVLAEQVARLPGVSFTRQGGPGANADLLIRGATTRYVAIYVDGILVTDPSATNIQYDDFGGFGTGNVARVELLKGSQSALFGGTAVGGVIDVATLGGADLGPGVHQSASAEGGSYGSLAGAYSLTRNTDRATLTFGISSARSDGFSAADENNGNTEADGFERTRVAAGATFRPNDAVTVGANAFFETGTVEFDGSDPLTFEPADTATFNEVGDREAIGARAFFAFDGPTFDNEFALTWYQVDRSLTGDFGTSEFRGERLQATNVTSFAVSGDIDASVGLDYRSERSTSTALPDGRATIDTLGGYVEAVYAPTDRLDVIGTLRLDDNSVFGSFVTGRLAFAYRPDAATTFRGAVATGYRPPSASELFEEFPPFFAGNPALEPETSVTAEIGIDRTFGNGATVSATLFWGEIDNLITLTPDFSSLENVAGASVRQGLEISGSLPVSERVSLYGAATLLEARAADGSPIPRVPSTDIVLGGTIDVSDRARVSANARYVAGLFDRGDYLPSFVVVNAGAEVDLTERASAYLRVENLFDTEYQTTRGYGTSDLALFAGVRARF